MGKLYRRHIDGGDASSPLGEGDGILRSPTGEFEYTFAMHVAQQPEFLLAGNQRSEVNVVGGDHGVALVPVGHLVPTGLDGALEGEVSHGRTRGGQLVVAMARRNRSSRFWQSIPT